MVQPFKKARPAPALPLLALDPIFSEETEQAVLGGILLDNSLMADMADLTVDDFHVERHKALWGAFLALWHDGKPVDLRTVEDRLVLSGEWEEVGGAAYLAGLDLNLPDIGRLPHYKEIVLDKSARRKIQAGGLRMIKEASSFQGGGRELFSRVEAWLRKEDVKTNGSLGKSLGVIAREEQARPPFEMRTITGIQRIDRLTAGLQRKTVTVVAGRTSMGKTALSAGMARANAKLGYNVSYFSLEDGCGTLYRRLLAQESGVPFETMRNAALDPADHLLDPAQVASIHASERTMATWELYIEDSGPRTPDGIVSWALRKHAADGMDIFFLDHLHELSDDHLAPMIRGCRFLANELEIPVVVLSQFNRDNSRRAFQKEGDARIDALRPQLHDLRECGAIEQTADLAILLFRRHVYDDQADPRKAEALIAKNRNGQAPITIPLDWDGPTMTYRSA